MAMQPIKPFFNPPELQVQTREDGVRHYRTPSGLWYPSITTILSHDKADIIAKWEKRVGEKEANAKKTRGARRGTAIHDAMEQYLLHGVYPDPKDNPLFYENFTKIVPFMKRVKHTIVLEAPLYSDLLKIAGRCDLGAILIDDERYIIDFKTSAQSLKKFDKLKGYFTQASAYSIMLKETYHIDIPKLKIVCAVDDEPGFEEYDSQRKFHLDDLVRVKKKYDNEVHK